MIEFQPHRTDPAFCIYCHADVVPLLPDHAIDCPFTTNVWPVTTYERYVCCTECSTPLVEDTAYTTIGVLDERGLPVEVICCLGCAAHQVLGVPYG